MSEISQSSRYIFSETQISVRDFVAFDLVYVTAAGPAGGNRGKVIKTSPLGTTAICSTLNGSSSGSLLWTVWQKSSPPPPQKCHQHGWKQLYAICVPHFSRCSYVAVHSGEPTAQGSDVWGCVRGKLVTHSSPHCFLPVQDKSESEQYNTKKPSRIMFSLDICFGTINH